MPSGALQKVQSSLDCEVLLLSKYNAIGTCDKLIDLTMWALLTHVDALLAASRERMRARVCASRATPRAPWRIKAVILSTNHSAVYNTEGVY